MSQFGRSCKNRCRIPPGRAQRRSRLAAAVPTASRHVKPKLSPRGPRLRQNHSSCPQIPSPDRQRRSPWFATLFRLRNHRRRGTPSTSLDESQSHDGGRAWNGAFCRFTYPFFLLRRLSQRLSCTLYGRRPPIMQIVVVFRWLGTTRRQSALVTQRYPLPASASQPR